MGLLSKFNLFVVIVINLGIEIGIKQGTVCSVFVKYPNEGKGEEMEVYDNGGPLPFNKIMFFTKISFWIL